MASTASPAAILSVLVEAQTSTATAQMAKFDASMRGSAANTRAQTAAMRRSVGAMNTIGRDLTKYVTLPIVAIGAASVKMAADFNHSMELIHTQAGASQREVDNLKKSVLDFAASGKSAHGPEDLAKSLFHIESSGFRGAKAMDALKQSEALATTGSADMEQTTNALVGALNSGVKGAHNMGKTVATLNAIVGAGNMRMDDLTAALGTGFLTNAKQVGVTLSQAGAALATLTRQGQPATQSATRLSMAFRMMEAPSAQASKALNAIGLSASQLGVMMQKGQFPQAIALLVQHLNALGNNAQGRQQAAAVIREIFGARSATGINAIIQGLKTYNSTLDQINKKGTTGAFSEQHNAAMATAAEKLDVAWAQIQASLIRIGGTLLPVVASVANDFAGATTTIVGAWDQLPGPIKDVTVGIVGAAAVLGPLLVMTSSLIKAWGTVRVAVMGAEAAMGAGGAAEAAAGAGAGAAGLGALATAAVVAVPALIAVGGAFAAVKTKGQDLMAGITGEGKAFQDQVDKIIASGQHLTNAQAHQIATRAIQLGNEGQVNAKWAAQTVNHMGQVIDSSARTTKAIDQFVNIATGKFQFLSKSATFEFNKIENAVLSGADPTHQLIASYDALANRISKAMNTGAVSVDQGTKKINQLLAQEMSALGMQPIPGGAFTLPTQTTGPLQKGQKGQSGQRHIKRAGGGLVPGMGSGDKVPLHIAGQLAAMVEPGEYVSVANRSATQALMSVNAQVPRRAQGGTIPSWKGVAPGVVDDIAAAALNKEAAAARAILSKMQSRAASGPRQAGGPKGTANYMGVTMAVWVADALRYAAAHGSGNPQPTSGYRPGFDPHAPSGSEHALTQYPGGAVDFGGMVDPAALPKKMAVVNATKNYRYPLLAPIGFRDDGHASGTGHMRGGVIRLASGGVVQGKVSTFGPPNEAAGTTASGVSSSAPGIAIYDHSTLGKMFQVQIGAHKANLRQTDIGPAPWTGRKIDVTGAGARAMGINPSHFPTDSWARATLVSALPSNAKTPKAPKTTGKSGSSKVGPSGDSSFSVPQDIQDVITNYYAGLQGTVDAKNAAITNLNSLLGGANTDALQRYMLGQAQNPMVGASSPLYPSLYNMNALLPNAPSAPDLSNPSLSDVNTAAIDAYLISRGMSPVGVYGSQSTTPVVHNHVHIHHKKGAPNLNDLIDVRVDKKLPKTARRGNRPLAGGRRH